jgi:hypothetical protein
VKQAWFPDWTGGTVVVVGAGPLAHGVDLTPARGRAKVIAINESWRLCPWADALYCCDGGLWSVWDGLPEFAGLKITADQSAADRYGLHLVKVLERTAKPALEPGVLASGSDTTGGNSGFQALNLAAQLGAGRAVCVGFDMSLAAGVHWHGPHGRGLANPKPPTMDAWRRCLDAAASDFAAMGLEVSIASETALTAYPRVDLADALK